MRFKLTCLYCNHKWEKLISNYLTSRGAHCPICGDSNVLVKEYNKSAINYYEGAPEFVDPPEVPDAIEPLVPETNSNDFVFPNYFDYGSMD